jgi:hypothetical protein
LIDFGNETFYYDYELYFHTGEPNKYTAWVLKPNGGIPPLPHFKKDK